MARSFFFVTLCLAGFVLADLDDATKQRIKSELDTALDNLQTAVNKMIISAQTQIDASKNAAIEKAQGNETIIQCLRSTASHSVDLATYYAHVVLGGLQEEFEGYKANIAGTPSDIDYLQVEAMLKDSKYADKIKQGSEYYIKHAAKEILEQYPYENCFNSEYL